LFCPFSLSHPYLHSFPTRRSSDLRWRRKFIYSVVHNIRFVGKVEQMKKQTSKEFILMQRESMTYIKTMNMRNVLNCVVEEKARRSEEHTSELQSRFDLVCRLLLEK